MNKSVGNSAHQSYSSETYHLRRENQNNSRGKQMLYLERNNNAVGGSQAINSDGIVKDMGPNKLDGKMVGYDN